MARATTDGDETTDAADADAGGSSRGRTGSATLPRTGVGPASASPWGGVKALVAGVALLVGGAGYALRRRLA